MGPPRLGWQDIPLAHAADTLHLPLPGDPPRPPWATRTSRSSTNRWTGRRTRPAVERDPLFPERVNVGFAQVLAPDRLRLRVWERGAGLTLACGSGACAALVNASRRGLTGRSATVVVDGGVLDVAWRDDGHVDMTGPVATAFQGEFDLDAFPA